MAFLPTYRSCQGETFRDMPGMMAGRSPLEAYGKHDSIPDTSRDLVTTMGQRNRITKRTLEQSPYCVFCGVGTPATTLDHVPARAQFWGRRRPQGLEVPACKPCNHGTSSLEKAASAFARIRATDLSALEQDEFRRIAQNVERSFSGWSKELKLTTSQQQAFNHRFGHAKGVVSAANMESPLAWQSMNTVGS